MGNCAVWLLPLGSAGPSGRAGTEKPYRAISATQRPPHPHRSARQVTPPKPASLPSCCLSGKQHEWVSAGASQDTIIRSVFGDDIEITGNMLHRMRGGPLIDKVHSG